MRELDSVPIPAAPPPGPPTTVVGSRPGILRDFRPGFAAWLKAVAIGACLVAVPWIPLAWILRLWIMGWLLETQARYADGAVEQSYPSWRRPWALVRHGLSGWLELVVLLLPGSMLLHQGWVSGWIISFEKVHDFNGHGPLTVVAGLAVVGWSFVLLPMASVLAARTPGTRASWDLSQALGLVLARPWRYLGVLGLTALLCLPLQLLRQPDLQKPGEHLLAGAVSFAITLALRGLWARHYRLAAAVPEAERWKAWTALFPPVLGMWVLGILHAFALVVAQFIMWNSAAEWFAHPLFLLPGAPAPVGGPQLYW